ncbi:sensor histidine kinase, partial [Acinetobacter baumannii]
TETQKAPATGDQAALERALTNLVQNAIQHGGRRGTSTIAVTRDGSIEVSDEGDGIPPDQHERIFEPFHRLKPLDRGAGLGLNL